MAGARRAALRLRSASWVALISLGLLLACNSIVGFDDLTKQKRTLHADTGPDDDDLPPSDDDDDEPDDGGDTSPRCDPKKPFEMPLVLDGLGETTDTGNALMTPDELELFYLRGKSSPYDFRHAKRRSRDPADVEGSRWGEPVTEVLSPIASVLSSIVLSGTKLYYQNIDTSSGQLNSSPYAATRPSLGAAFSPGTKIGGVNFAISVPNNDDAAYWSKVVLIDGTGDEVIYCGNLQGTGIVGGDEVPVLHFVPALDTHVVIAKNQLVIYFASQRKIPGALGASDVYRASRKSLSESFSEPVNVTELNSETIDEPTWVSDDDCVILLQRSRHILIARRPP